MKAREHIADLRAMDMPALDERLKEARTELFNLRFQAATGQLENHRQIRTVKRQIAQLLTVIQGRLLGFEGVVASSALGPSGAAKTGDAQPEPVAQPATATAGGLADEEGASEEEPQA